VTVQRFYGSRSLFDFLSKERLHRLRKLRLSEYSGVKICHRIGMPKNSITVREEVRNQAIPVKLLTGFAQDLGAQIFISVATKSLLPVNPETCQEVYQYLVGIRDGRAIENQRDYSLTKMSKYLNVARPRLRELNTGKRARELDVIIALSEFLDVPVHLELEHNFPM
jgi:hypothetical protein